MASGEKKSRTGAVLKYGFGGALLMGAAGNVLIGSPWYLPLGIAATAGIIMLGQRRVFRPGVTRVDDEIVCRFLPWYEANSYVLLVFVPLLGVAAVGAGSTSGHPVWVRYVGIFLLGVALLMAYAGVRMWRRSVLRISPDALFVRLAVLGSQPTEIPRQDVQSIQPRTVPNPVSGTSLQTQITYRPTHPSDDAAKTMQIGAQLTVQPEDLASALVVWNDGADDEPSELMDRIERILRGHSPGAG